ncbi:MAG: methyl-accepting chemotaxis protein [Lacipirellulaceae bacterium]
MPLLTLSRFSKPAAAERPATPSIDQAELDSLRGEAAAIRRSYAVIEFTTDGTILGANDAFLGAMGYSLDEVQGRHHRMFCDPTFAASPEYGQFWRRLAHGEYFSAEYQRFAKGGRGVWIQASYNPVLDAAGKPVKVVKFATDITPQKQAAAEVAAKIAAIGRSQAVIEFDLDGTILTANENFLKTVGYTLDEVCGRHHRMFVENAYASSDEYARFWQRLRAGEYQAGEFRRLGKGGNEVWIQASYNPVFDASGRPVKVVKFASDITQQVEARHASSIVGQSVATSVTEMVATIDEIAKSVSRTASLASEAEGFSRSTVETVGALSESSRKIGDVVGVIQELADQTNLLALNATIEAARAGESGRSFAVVASEVKELATATAKATGEIELAIREIQSRIDQVVVSSGQIGTSVSEVSVNTNTVAAAIEEQSATMAELGQTAERLLAITNRG